MTTRSTPDGTPPVNPERPEDDDAVPSPADETRPVDEGATPDDPPAASAEDVPGEEPVDAAQDAPAGTTPEASEAATGTAPDEEPADAPVVAEGEPSVPLGTAETAAPHPLERWTAAEVPWDVAAELGDDAPYVPIQAAPDVTPAPSAEPTTHEAAAGVDRYRPTGHAPDARAAGAQTAAGSATGSPGSRPDAAEENVAPAATPSPAPAPAPAPAPKATAGTEARTSGWSKLARAMRPTANRSQLLAGLLCALLGFALAVQVSQTQEEQLSSLRQTDLVRLLDDVTQRANELEARVSSLQETRDELSSGSGQQRAALELAQRQAESQGILSGRLPAEGPGIELTITEGDRSIPASKLFNILEELRNAGVEVVEVNGVRLVTSSYFEETSRGMVVDGQVISSPYRWKAIGDPSTLETALEIPGGAMASVRNEGADPVITQQDLVTITSTREPQAPQFATPVPAESGD
ncbi:DUF881 domain-containing protein [Oerskovia sp. Sa1BUA8]|uniref:DUF881 domain-containing protein n=1 Tax=Oerskovia douganii TaxID=2762210 RepID=A0A9D5UA83_9CELL|nr:DUF881 domain-containing protein [Oerskovia douganii]MBE7700993.1 DUF881 domain-containing protein [Oerskovia douganii]